MYDKLYEKLRPLLTSTRPDIHELQALRYELAEARASALQTLYEARPTRLRPKDKEWTDLDRRTEMEAFTAHLEHDKQFLDDLWQVASDIIELQK